MRPPPSTFAIAPIPLGATNFGSGKRVKFVPDKVAKYTPEKKAALEKVIIALSAEAQLKSQLAADQHDAAIIEEGWKLFKVAD